MLFLLRHSVQQRATEVVLGSEPELCLCAAEKHAVLTHQVTRDIRIKATEYKFSADWKKVTLILDTLENWKKKSVKYNLSKGVDFNECILEHILSSLVT